ncbi:peroxisomal coenzyme A diphosphatase NUDT7 [Latimeria chalumnae]|uniref:peroxisomal coenzyme A diphosphatase NUDT7 n=1 Tax=Latimeria chalumnae TaxID=7897 RepID=UPI00313BC380
MEATTSTCFKERIKEIMGRYATGNKYSNLSLPKASVLVPMLLKDQKLHVLLTVRSMKLKTFQGDVCFPGGKSELQDRDEIDTALREANEEIGLPADQVDVVCCLPPLISKNGILVTPVLAFINEAFQAKPNPEEVSDVFLVPLDYFINPVNYNSLTYKLPSGKQRLLHSFTYNDPQNNKPYVIWGLTAFIAIIVAVIALGKKPQFEVDFEVHDPYFYINHFLRESDAKSKL